MLNFLSWVIRKLEPFPNYGYGVLVAKGFLIRGLQLSLKELVYLKSWEFKMGHFSVYRRDARGGGGYFEVECLVTFWGSSSQRRAAYALLQISCDSEEHRWEPNHCGSFICIDGEKFFEIRKNLPDIYSGNIELGVEGCGSHVPEEFKVKATAIPWESMRAL